jgi:hypothetical protein
MVKVRKDGYTPLDTTLKAQAGGRVQLQNVALAEAASEGTASDATLADNAGAADGEPAANRSADPSATSDPPTTEPQTTEPDPPSDPSAAPGDDAGTEPASAPQDDPVPSGGNASGPAETEDAPTGLLEVTPGSPNAVTVLVDGTAQPDGQAVTLTEGTHTVTCRHQRHGSVETTVTVAAGRTETLSCYFERDLTITAQGPWGRIWLNRSDTGKQTPSPLSLPPGTHRIELRRETLDDFAVEGGVVRTKRGGESQTSQFGGRSYQIQVDPGFTEVEYAISFKTTGG